MLVMMILIVLNVSFEDGTDDVDSDPLDDVGAGRWYLFWCCSCLVLLFMLEYGIIFGNSDAW